MFSGTDAETFVIGFGIGILIVVVCLLVLSIYRIHDHATALRQDIRSIQELRRRIDSLESRQKEFDWTLAEWQSLKKTELDKESSKAIVELTETFHELSEL